MSGLLLPKPRPSALDKADRRKALTARDERESDVVRVRSGGWCEVLIRGQRCGRKAVHVHHLMGGIGVRGRGVSALSENKVHCCDLHHREIHAHVLLHLGGRRFERVE